MNHDYDECLPEETKTFQKVDRDGNILQCPVCHTFFWYTCIVDNDVYCPRHEENLTEMTEELAMSIIKDEQADDQAYHHAIEKRFGAFVETLDGDEREVFQFLIERRGDGADLSWLKCQFPNDHHRLLQIIHSLLEKKLITERISRSLTSGKSGFQEEVEEINDWNIHYQTSFDYYDFITKRWAKKSRQKGSKAHR